MTLPSLSQFILLTTGCRATAATTADGNRSSTSLVWLRVWSNSFCCVCEACHLQHGVKAVRDTPENCLPLQKGGGVCLHTSDKGIIGTWGRRVCAILRKARASVIPCEIRP